MAIVKYGTIVTGIRGKVGGAIFSANKGSSYVRQWSKPPDQKTPTQTVYQGVMAYLAEYWRNLTTAQRAAWNTWAALPAQELTNSLGEGYYVSGYNWWQTISYRRAIIGAFPSIPVPTSSPPPAPVLSSLTVYATGGSTGTLTYASGTFGSDYYVAFAALAPGPGSSVWYKGFLLIDTSTTPGLTSMNVQTELEAVFGTLQVGQRVYMHVIRQTPDAIRSPIASIDTTVI